ncbi:MAG: PAS domain-containing protein [Methylococcales bacterium]
MKKNITPTNKEIVMRDNDFIASKTDAKGRLTYCNRIFIEFSGYSEPELLGQQHNIVRHPDMPRAVFHLLWKTIKSGDEFFGYVKNISANGDYYWVLANVTPSYGKNKEISGFFSVRRKPDPVKLKIISSIYQNMLVAEKQAGTRDAITAGTKVLTDIIEPTGKDYREFILSL